MVGTGVLVQTGVVYSFAAGPIFSALTGGSIFVGAGSSTNVGVINIFSASSNSHHGQGTLVYDAGDSTWVGCPSASAIAVSAFYGLGGAFSHPAGNMVFVGNPFFGTGALQYFAGLGGLMYVGAGSAVIGRSPIYFPIARLYVSGEAGFFYVQVRASGGDPSCWPE